MEIVENKFIKEKFNTRLLKMAVIILLGILLLGINNTYIYYSSLKPFGVSVIYALMYVGFNGYVLSAVYLLTNIIFNFEISSIIISINCCYIPS